MKHRSRKIMSLVLALMLCFARIPTAALATGTAGSTGTPDTSWYTADKDAYAISSADELAGLAVLVNDGNDFSGVTITLTDDIDLDAYSSGWTPIGTESAPYAGTFDGDGFEISGLSITTTADHIGLFGYVTSGTIRNLTVSGEINVSGNVLYAGGIVGTVKNGTLSDLISSVNVTGETETIGSTTGKGTFGGVAASAEGDGGTSSSTVERCTYIGTVTASGVLDCIGGIVGYMNAAEITDCINCGEVNTAGGTAAASSTGGIYTGGIVGYINNANAVVTNCANIGEVSGVDSTVATSYTGAVIGRINKYVGKVSNCYYLSTSADAGVAGNGSSVKAETTAKTADAFAGGEVAYLLNGGVTNGTQVWYQNIDNGMTADSRPVLDSSHGTVYCGVDCAGTAVAYSNTIVPPAGHAYDPDGFCTVCGAYEPAALNGDGVYEIGNAGQLFWFAALVSGDTTQEGITAAEADASGKLTADVAVASGFPTSGTLDLNGYTLTYTGKSSITVSGSETLIITDSSTNGAGELVLSPNITANESYFIAEGSLTLQNITVASSGSVVYAQGDGTCSSPSVVLIENCEITTAGVYVISTNAKNADGKALYSGVSITIVDSTITANADDGDDCAIMMNVEGNLTIENSTITGNRQTVAVRAGAATITDSTLIVTGEHTQKLYTDEEWSTGNEVPSAALLVGNLNGGYYGDADVTVTNTVITSKNPANANAVYVDSNADYSGSVDISGSKTEVTGTVTTGQSTSGNSSVSISGGTYSTDVSAYFVSSIVATVTTADGSKTTVYTSFADAVANANGGTVTLYADITVSDDLTISDSLTLDLNGHDLTISAAATLTVDDGVTVAITDTDSVSGGAVSNNGIIVNHGTIDNNDTIYNNGTIISDGMMVNKDTIYNNGSITVSDGTLDTEAGEIIDSGSFSISGGGLSGKLTPTLTAEPTAKTGLTYDGSAQTLAGAGSANGGTVNYSLTGDAGDWSADIPAVTAAGTYTVYYKIVGDSSHADYTPASNSFTVTIAQATPASPVSPTLGAVTYSEGRTLSSIALDSGWAWADGTVVPQAGNNSYTVYYAVDDANYDWSGVADYDAANHRIERTVTLTVNASQLAAPTNLSWSGTTTTVTASWNEVDHADGYLVQLYRDGTAQGDAVSVTGISATFGITAAGSYTFRVTAVGTGNYSSCVGPAASGALTFHTVTWQNEGIILETDVVLSGATTVYSGTAPTKATDATCIYTFSGWTPTVGPVTADTTYTAVYSSTFVAPAAGVGYSIDYSAETVTAASGYELSTDGLTWSSTLSITAGSTFYVRRAADSGAAASEATATALVSRSAAPYITAVDEEWLGEGGARITGVTTAMEYSSDGITWTDCTGTTIEGLTAGTYYVRYSATNSAPASESASVTIASGAKRIYILTVAVPAFASVTYGYTQPAAEGITITNSGNSDATISGVAVDSASFLIGGSGSTVPAGGSIGTWTIRPADGLAAGTYTATVTVTYNNNATATAEVSFIVNRAVQSVSYSEDSVSVHINGASFINALTKTTLDGALTYASENTKVATVDETTGEVAIIGAGTTLITATAAGTENYAEAKASYTLTVTDHTTELHNAKAATWTEDGYTGDEACIVCGETVKTGTAIAATGSGDPDKKENTGTASPTDSTKPATENNSEGLSSLRTGDDSKWLLWMVLLFISGAGFVSIEVYGKKKRAG